MHIADRLRGVAVGAAVGDALGMPLEFGPRIPGDRLVREMRSGRIAAGSFTDDTEMALALADSLRERFPLDPANLSGHFLAWYRTGPSDVGIQTSAVLRRLAAGEPWEATAHAVQASRPDSAGNGSVMRCWPVAVAYHGDRRALIEASELQSRVTHPHPDCATGCAFINLTVHYLVLGEAPRMAVERATQEVALPHAVRIIIQNAATKTREQLQNSGWVRHTLESAVWGLLNNDNFEETVVQVANLGNDADTAAAVAGALAGAAYGLSGIPLRWRKALRGHWPVNGPAWDETCFVELADRLSANSAVRS
jgi:ADP-ribosyl-[dinitrogen reductase] hydrolase